MPSNTEVNETATHPVYNHPSLEIFFNGIFRMENQVGQLTYLEQTVIEPTEDEQLAEVSFSPHTKFIELRTREISAAPNLEFIHGLHSPNNLGIDIQSEIQQVLETEHIQSIHRDAMRMAFELGETNFNEVNIPWNGSIQPSTIFTDETIRPVKFKENPWQWFLNIFRFKENKVTVGDRSKSIPNSAHTVENVNIMQRQLTSKVLQLSNMIMHTSRRGPANTIICGSQIATALQNCSGFMVNHYAVRPQYTGTLQHMGSLFGMTLYVDPYMRWDDNRILIFRKGNIDEPGMSLCYMDVPDNIHTIIEGTLSPRVVRRVKETIVETGFRPHVNYISAQIDIADMM